MKTKKYISLLMAIIMMLSLFAGCGSEGNTPSVSDDTKPFDGPSG